MTGGQYKYDIAFSFAFKDEPIVLALNDKLQERFKTFIYSEHQKVLAGRNGEDAFSKVYGSEARLVVILFRSEWGSTPFTQIEQRAIRNRAFEKTYDFTFFIVTEPGVKLPEWLERTRLYYGLERFGLDGAAGAIESKLMELGANPQVETVADRAARLERSLKFEEDKKRFASSDQAVKSFRAAIQATFSEMVVQAESLKSARLPLTVQEHHGFKVAYGLGAFLTLAGGPRYANTIDGAEFQARFWDNVPEGLPGFIPGFDPGRLVVDRNFRYELQPDGHPAFVDSSNRTYTPEALAAHLLTEYMNASERLRKSRE